MQSGLIARTVSEACALYVANMRVVKGPEAARPVETRFESLIYCQPLGSVRLEDLQPLHVERWRNDLVTPARKKNSVNRVFRQFAAAMNYAKSRGCIESAHSWKSVGQFPVRDGRRNGYLTLDQRRALIAACEREKDGRELAADPDLAWSTPDLGDLLRGLFFSGARPGELVKAKVSDLDVRRESLTLTSAKNKKGEARRRDFLLFEPAALEFFRMAASNKSPEKYLITRRDGSAWVDQSGRPRYAQWARGLRATIRDVNRNLEGYVLGL
jgi:integrase